MITTTRLRLRRPAQADVDAVLAYRSRPDVARHLSAGVWTRDRAERELADYEGRSLERVGDELVLLVETIETTEVVGEVGLVWLDEPTSTAEVGYVFNPEFGGRGFATEAVAAAIRAAFDTYGFQRIVAHTDEANAASRALRDRVGMTLLSVRESGDGRGVTECVYGAERSSFRPADSVAP